MAETEATSAFADEAFSWEDIFAACEFTAVEAVSEAEPSVTAFTLPPLEAATGFSSGAVLRLLLFFLTHHSRLLQPTGLCLGLSSGVRAS